MKKLVFLAIIMGLATAPAFAASQYYVTQKASDKTCSVSTTKPDGKVTLMVGTSPYKTQLDATVAMKAAPECKKK